jgi:hypothetical protein
VASLFSDSFTRADSSTLGTGWFEFNSGTPSATWEIFTNQLRSPNAGSPANAHYACTTSAAHTATADAKTTCKRISGTSWDGGPLVRRQGDAGAGTNTFYYVDVTSATAAQIYREVAGTDTAVGAAITGTFADGDTYAIEASGTTLNFYNNGSLVASRTDSNISAAGYGGVAMWSASGIWDDFDFSSLAAAAGLADDRWLPSRGRGRLTWPSNTAQRFATPNSTPWNPPPASPPSCASAPAPRPPIVKPPTAAPCSPQ